MYVPNYIPDPIEVPNNVNDQRWTVRLAFIRRVSVLHFASVGVIALLATSQMPRPSLAMSLVVVGFCLLIMSLVRIETRGTRADVLMSVGLLPILLTGISFVVRDLADLGYPMWAPGIGIFCAVVYTGLCGRDFSFVGQFILSFIASSVAIAGLVLLMAKGPREAAWALGMNAGVLAFLVYDFASLLARRRAGEELGAVVDLYRDVLNFGGYAVRVVRHWKKHRIWNLAK